MSDPVVELAEWRHELDHQAGHNEEHWYRIKDRRGKYIARVRGIDNANSICEEYNATIYTQQSEKIEHLRSRLAIQMEALEWYGDEAKAIAKNAAECVNTDALLASVTVLSLDGGKKARAALKP